MDFEKISYSGRPFMTSSAWGIAGKINSRLSSTAFGLPGKLITRLFPLTPAIARESKA